MPNFYIKKLFLIQLSIMYLRKQNTHCCIEDYLPLISDKSLNNAYCCIEDYLPLISDKSLNNAMLHFQRPLKMTKNHGVLSEFLLY